MRLDGIQRGKGTIADGALIRLRVRILMRVELYGGAKGLRAAITNIQTLRAVNAQMMRVYLVRLEAAQRKFTKRLSIWKTLEPHYIPLIAGGAHIRPYVCVRAQVERQRVGNAKRFAAHLAAVGLLASVDALVLHLFIGPREDALAVLTGESWFILV